MSGSLNSAQARTTKLKKGDEVIVTTGRSKGQIKVEKIDHKNDKIFVSNVNLQSIKKQLKKTQRVELSKANASSH